MAKIDSKNARDKLDATGTDGWQQVQVNRFIGYRPSSVKGKPGSWAARILVGNKQEQRSLRTSLLQFKEADRFEEAKKLAEQWWRQFDLAGVTSDPTVVRTLTLAEVLQQYEKHIGTRQRDGQENYGKKAARAARCAFDLYVMNYPSKDDSWADRPLSQITAKHFKAWRAWYDRQPNQGRGVRRGKPRTKESINRSMVPFSAALNLAAEVHDLPPVWANHMKKLALTQNEKSEHKTQRMNKRLTIAQRASLLKGLSECGDADAAAIAPMIRAMCLAPIRPGALATLKVCHLIAPEKGQHAHLHVWADKAGGGRMVALPPDLYAVMKAQADKIKFPQSLLFPRPNGGQWDSNSWRRALNRGIAHAGDLPAGVGAYWLRHTVLSQLMDANQPVIPVAALAGTSAAMIEQHYYNGEADKQVAILSQLSVGLQHAA